MTSRATYGVLELLRTSCWLDTLHSTAMITKKCMLQSDEGRTAFLKKTGNM